MHISVTIKFNGFIVFIKRVLIIEMSKACASNKGCKGHNSIYFYFYNNSLLRQNGNSRVCPRIDSIFRICNFQSNLAV